MSPTIEIDDDVFDALKQHAEPFVDSPNDVLRRLLVDSPSARQAAVQEPNNETSIQPQGREPDHVRNTGPGRIATTPVSGQRGATNRKRARSSDLLPEESFFIDMVRFVF